MTLVECGFCKLMFEPCCSFWTPRAYGMRYFIHLCTDHDGNKRNNGAVIQYNQIHDMDIFKVKTLKGMVFHIYNKNCIHNHEEWRT